MYFKKLSMHGFKSFADPVTIEFDKGITCVVGPNGSGKSNISDALRWVLGEQSPKMLRGGKMDEVIFAGTDQRKSRGMAEVSLVIDNADHSLPIDFAEVSLTRRMYRSGESEYYINDSQCRLRDIRELIMDTGIGVDGYSLIGQGKIAEIVSGRPESRREIFEEAAGIVKYRTKKAETERKLESTTQNLERVNDIITELESRIEPLKAESAKAREYVELNAKYKENEINVTLKNIEQTEKSAGSLQNDSNELEKKLFEVECERENTENDIRKRRQRVEEIDKEDYETREEIMNFNNEMNDLKNAVRLSHEKIASLKNSSRLHEDEKLNLEEKLSREEKYKAELEANLKELTDRAMAAQSKLNDATTALSTENNKYAENNLRFTQDRDKIYELSVESSSIAAQIQGLKDLRKTLEDRHAELSDVSEDAEDAAAYTEYNAAKKKLEDLREKESDRRIRLSGILSEVNELTVSEKKHQSELENSKISLSEEKTRKTMLKQLEDSYEGYNGAVRFIMKDAGIKGIYGTVGDLIEVPRGYETAIETALGARMQNIVCKDDACAEQAIRMLKLKKAGRLTFLPIESLRVQPQKDFSDLKNEEGFIGNASGCIQFDQKYAKAIEYLLGGIMVVKTLDNAISISKKHGSFRFVTLEGELINPAGAITGGAYKHNNTAGILDRKSRLNESDAKIFQLEKEQNEIEIALQRVVEKKNVAQNNLEEAQKEIRSLEMEILTAENEANTLSKRLGEYTENVERRQREIERINDEIDKNSADTSALDNKKTDIDKQIEDLKKNAEHVSQENETSKKTIDDLTEAQTNARIDYEAVNSEVGNVNKMIERSLASIKELHDDISSRQNSIQNALLEQQTMESNIKNSENEIKLRETTHTENSEKLRKLREEKENQNKEINKLQETKEEIDKRLYSLKTSKYDLGTKLESAATRIESWKNRLWDEFETSYVQAIEFKKMTFDLGEGIKESRRLKNALRELGDVNVNSIAEYENVSERYEFLTTQRKDLDESIASLRLIIEDTDTKIRTSFRSSFDAVSANFESIFSELFGGGKAELRIDGEDPLESNIDIIVQPPGKKLQNMNLLSGGEKTMTAIALMFAVLRTKPTPFCIMDEVEAALDEANIERFADYLKKFTDIQFVLVTHQKVTMEHANVLYGVTMPEKGISKVLSLRLADAEKLEGLE